MRQSAPLKRLRLEMVQQTRILRQLGALFPAELIPHLLAARVKDGELILYTDTAAWATRLRFLAPQALRAVRALHLEVHSVTVRVSLVRQPRGVRPRVRPISAAAAQVIAEAGTTVTDAALREALQRLASHHKD